MESKVCKKCSQAKPTSEYYNSKVTKTGKGYTCKECVKAVSIAYQRSNMPRLSAEAAAKRSRNKRKAVEKFGNKCIDCGKTYPPYVYDFHHLDPSQKEVTPTATFAMSEENMWAELSKCVLLCANCHRIRHHGN